MFLCNSNSDPRYFRYTWLGSQRYRTFEVASVLGCQKPLLVMGRGFSFVCCVYRCRKLWWCWGGCVVVLRVRMLRTEVQDLKKCCGHRVLSSFFG